MIESNINSKLNKRENDVCKVLFLGSWWVEKYYWYCSVVAVYLRSQSWAGSKWRSLYETLHEIITGKNILKQVNKILIQFNLKWNLTKCVWTDGDKNKRGKVKG